MIKFKFHEERDIADAVESNSMDFSNPRNVIWILALYYIKIKQVDVKNVLNLIVKYMSEHDPNFYYEQYLSDIKKCINKASKYEIKNVGTIKITTSEMDIIKSFDDIKKEKIVFVLVALAKYFNALYGHDRDCLFAKTSDIFKHARVVIPASERDYYLHFAYESGVLLPNFSVGANMQLVGIVSHKDDDEVVLELNEYDYKELAYTYLNYKDGGYKRCATCGAWFKIKSSEPGTLYCHLHKPKSTPPIEYKVKTCIDCGKEFYVSSKNNQSVRCEDCYSIYRRKQKTETMKQLRLKT